MGGVSAPRIVVTALASNANAFAVYSRCRRSFRLVSARATNSASSWIRSGVRTESRGMMKDAVLSAPMTSPALAVRCSRLQYARYANGATRTMIHGQPRRRRLRSKRISTIPLFGDGELFTPEVATPGPEWVYRRRLLAARAFRFLMLGRFRRFRSASFGFGRSTAVGASATSVTHASAQRAIAETASSNARPFGVSSYSTRPDAAPETIRTTTPSDSSSRRRSTSILSLTSGIPAAISLNRRRPWSRTLTTAPAQRRPMSSTALWYFGQTVAESAMRER